MSDKEVDNRALLSESLWRHPDQQIRDDYQALIARAHPMAKEHLPAVVVREEGAKMLARGEKLIADFEARQAKRDIESERTSWQSRLLKGFKGPDGSTLKVAPEDIPEIEKVMVEHSTASPEMAAGYYLAQKRVAAPSSAPSYGIRIPGQEGTGDHFKGLMANPDAWAREEANKMWGEFKAGRGQQYLDN